MRRTRTLTALTAVGAGLVLAVPAQAAIVDRYVNEFSFTFGPIDCEGFTVSGSGEGRVLDTLKQRGPTGAFWSYQGIVDFTYTNDQNGRSWTSRDTFYEHDTRVLSQDGDALEMLVTAAQRSEIFDENGELDSANRGMAQWVWSIDTQGTPQRDDDDVDFAYPVRSHGSYQVGDFCEDAVRFTTG
jgi:hypothetical protein